MDLQFDKNYVLSLTKDILETDSPSGYGMKVMAKIQNYAEGLGYSFAYTNKGIGIIFIKGRTAKTIGLCAHVDTLGLMVRSIKRDGTLAVTSVGSPLLPTLDGEYCKIITRSGSVFTGTILCNSPAAHVYKNAATLERTENNFHVRIDQVVKNKEDVKKLGIMSGDFICIDPKTIITDSGFIKSRFLDDKLSVGILFGVLKYLRDYHVTPQVNVTVLISTYEEVGHGMSFLPEGLSELIAVDMGCIGEDLACTEYDVSICPKDSSGPYDYLLTGQLIQLAKDNKLKYAVDIYPFYGSDVSAAQNAGNDVKGALIGPGVHASHGMERSHYSAIENTMKLVALYIQNPL